MAETANWYVTVRVHLKHFCEHSELEAERIVREVLDGENGFGGFCDWPDDYEILSIAPATPKAAP